MKSHRIPTFLPEFSWEDQRSPVVIPKKTSIQIFLSWILEISWNGGTKSSIFIGFSTTIQRFWGTKPWKPQGMNPIRCKTWQPSLQGHCLQTIHLHLAISGPVAVIDMRPILFALELLVFQAGLEQRSPTRGELCNWAWRCAWKLLHTTNMMTRNERNFQNCPTSIFQSLYLGHFLSERDKSVLFDILYQLHVHVVTMHIYSV